MVSSMHYYPELVDAAIRCFNPSTSTIEGQIISINISSAAIWNMLCIIDPVQRGMTVDTFNPK